MAKLTILRGISGSGKSTWARQQNALVVSRDDIRDAQFWIHKNNPADYYAQDKERLSWCERFVSIIQDNTVEGLLKSGADVIVDNTNIEWKFVKALAKIGYRCGAEVEVKVFDMDLGTAMMRDEFRGRNGGRWVGNDVIKKQYDRFSKNKSLTLDPVFVPEPYNGTPGKPKAFLVDIDGTLAHMRDYRGPFDWKKVGLDDVDEVISSIVRLLDLDYHIVVMSGRDSVCRRETMMWLDEHDIPWDQLFMRPERDMRPDNLIKAELFDTYVRDNYDVQFVLDDRDQVVDMWRRMGLTCLQVAPGDF